MQNKSISGFTIVELLIVIVILGILSGVVLSVVNPAAQQERARSAAVRATVEKACLALHSCVAYASLDTECDSWTDIGSAALPSSRNGTFGNGQYQLVYNAGMVTITGNYLKRDGVTTCAYSCTGDPSTGVVTNMSTAPEGLCSDPT